MNKLEPKYPNVMVSLSTEYRTNVTQINVFFPLV